MRRVPTPHGYWRCASSGKVRQSLPNTPGMPLQGRSRWALFMPKLLVWTLALLLPFVSLLFRCVSRSNDVVGRLGRGQLAVERRLAQCETFQPCVGRSAAIADERLSAH
jgi:hypothetical protein